ncbi:MAG: hypothetical protein ABIK09_11110 [Pseudomonadota bacterium]
MTLRLLMILTVLLTFAACNGSTNPVLLDTGTGEDTGSGEDTVGVDAPVGDDLVAPDGADEDVQAPCGCLSDAECAPAVAEACVAWRCVEGADGCGFCGQAPLDCDDGEPCTEDSCDPATGDCVHASIGEGEDCDDGDLCTVADTCDATGACTGLTLDCDDLNGCTLDECAPLTGECTHVNVAVACDDGDPCTEGDVCAGGACQPGPDGPDCDDANDCTDDVCDPGTGGCVHTPSAAPGCCESDEDCNDDNACTADTCDPEDGSCANVAVDGAPCDDGDACTLEDACIDGACTPAADLDCEDLNECTTDSCDPNSGCVHAQVADAAPCTDGNVCTQGDGCLDGVCVPGVPVACDDGDACTTDACVPGEGCVNTPIPLPDCCNTAADCNDGDVCTADTCEDNLCEHAPVIGPGCCVPQCTGKVCGPNGCGGTCGECLAGYCEAGQCLTVCVPQCAGKVCGPNGCGGSCGACQPGLACGPAGQCQQCVPQCAGAMECGADGCGGICGACAGGESCDPDGLCQSSCDCVGAACSGDGFEEVVPPGEGTLAGWMWSGDVQVIEHLGATPAPEGDRMALVSTGLIFPESGALWRAFCPPAGATHLEFSWRFYSEEFIEWCGSAFQDKFVVYVSVGALEQPVFSVTVQDLCPPTECAGCGGMFVGLEEADVAFDQGGVWMTPWQEASVALPAGLTGEGLTVRFEVQDVGDSIYDTASLIDDVRLVIPPPCLTDADCDDGELCTDDTCNPVTGSCSFAPTSDCCQANVQCDDQDPCTFDACVAGQCVNTVIPGMPGCCQNNADCDDGDPCTIDQCFFQQCFSSPSGDPGCCQGEVLLDEDFDDGAAQGWTLEPDQQPFPGFGWVIGGPGHSAPYSLQGIGMSFFPGLESVATTPTISLPAVEAATLDFWYQGLSADNQCPAGALTVRVGNSVVFSDCQQISGWLHAIVDLTELAPGNIALEFVPGSSPGLMLLATYAIDDVVIETSCAPLPMP